MSVRITTAVRRQKTMWIKLRMLQTEVIQWQNMILKTGKGTTWLHA